MDATTLVGKQIIRVRPLTTGESRQMDWPAQDAPAPALVLNDGTTLTVGDFDDGNCPGTVFGYDAAQQVCFTLPLGPAQTVAWTITAVRAMTAAEAQEEGWADLLDLAAPPVVLVLANNTLLYPALDDEGNGPGSWFHLHSGNQPALVLLPGAAGQQ